MYATHFEDQRPPYTLSSDPTRLDIDTIYNFLAHQAYWSRNIPRATLERAIRNSLCFGIFTLDRQIGFARVITDLATSAQLADVFILPEYRGQGLGKWLVGCILAHPDLQGLRRWSLATTDAHGLYARFGFQDLSHPEKQMEIIHPNPYPS